ncbi:MAG: hypothetical protein KAR22_05980, partial [Gammaproteobacteria bacterium]|nr:hypothetical protein [Gammaproteobacteria bacterium]
MLDSNMQGEPTVFPDDYPGWRIATALCSLLVVLFLSGCASEPILGYESDAPAQILSPIQAAGVKDGRARFREIFCERFDAIGPPKDGQPACADYLHRLADEPAV